MKSRLLLITPRFYGVEDKIKLGIEELGFEVSWIENRELSFDYHGSKSKLKFIRRIYFLLFFPQKKYLKKELSKIENLKFDILFSINGHTICPYLFKNLKSKNSGLFSVLYLWDSSSMYTWTKELKFFNKVFTFDHTDSRNLGLEYKPNFYIRNDTYADTAKETDLFFVGKFIPFRLKVIDKIISLTETAGIKYFIKMWTAYKILPHSYLVYFLLKKSNLKTNWIKNYILNYEANEGLLKRDFIIANSLNYNDVKNMCLASNVVLDLPYQEQTGYSHRLIDAIANGKKVVTTNPYIKNEVFYNSEQIHIINLMDPEINPNWIREKQKFPVDEYFRGLELSEWLNSIINAGIA